MRAHLSNWRRDAGQWLEEHRGELWIVAAIWAVLSLVIFLLASGHVSPRRHQDEFLFWGVAKSIAHGQGVTWRGQDLGLVSWLYPLMLAPAFWIADSVSAQYTIAHLLNSLMISAAIFPGFLMGRLMLDRWRALIAALMVVSVPAMNYAGVIGTESLAYPVFTAASGAMLLALARPRPRNVLLAFALLFACLLVRMQFIIAGPIFAGALLLACVMRPAGERVVYLSQRRLIWAPLVVIGLIGGLYVLIRGTAAFGLYGGAFGGVSLKLGTVWFWAKAFTADVYLLSAIVPTIATLAMFTRAENRRDPVIGPLLALALVASLALVAQVSWFSAKTEFDWRGQHIFYERYMFYVGPLYFVGFLAAFKRVSWRAALASTLLATLVMSGFQTDAVLPPFSYDSFGLTLIGWYMLVHPGAGPHIGMLLAGVTLLLGSSYVFATLRNKYARAAGWGLVALIFALLLAGQAKTWDYARDSSVSSFAAFPKPPDFISRSTRQPVGIIVSSEDPPLLYFTTEFWNPNVVGLFATDSAPIRSPKMYSPRCKLALARSGKIWSPDCDVIPNAWYLHSRNVVVHLKDEYKRVHPSPEQPDMTVMVGYPPARVLSLTDGRQVGSGIVQGQMTVRIFGDKPGKIRIRLQAGPKPAVIFIGKGSRRLDPGTRKTLSAGLAAPGGTLLQMAVRTPDGKPGEVAVTSLDIRQGDGPWQSIL